MRPAIPLLCLGVSLVKALPQITADGVGNSPSVQTAGAPPTFRKTPRIAYVPKSAAELAADPEYQARKAKIDAMKLDPKIHPLPNSKGNMYFEYAEHGYLGDNLILKDENGKSYMARRKPFTLKNGLVVTCGQINGLGGDFYGTWDPISDGKDLVDQQRRFLRAWYWLAEDTTRQPEEANKLISILQKEVTQVNKADAAGRSVEAAYSELPDLNFEFQAATIMRPAEVPAYLNLAKINWDHFGADARVAYNAAHSVALKTAAGGDLMTAYAMNAFADHFLEDSFASGHMRTPRRLLHGSVDPTPDLCAMHMHNEDNHFGLLVTNPLGKTWRAYGDKKLLEDMDKDNKFMVKQALQASVREVYNAYKNGTVPSPEQYFAWMWAPTLESARTNQTVVALFDENGRRRKDVDKRCTAGYTNNYWFWSTAASISTSRIWKDPMHLTKDCPKCGDAHLGSDICELHDYTEVEDDDEEKGGVKGDRLGSDDYEIIDETSITFSADADPASTSSFSLGVPTGAVPGKNGGAAIRDSTSTTAVIPTSSAASIVTDIAVPTDDEDVPVPIRANVPLSLDEVQAPRADENDNTEGLDGQESDEVSGSDADNVPNNDGESPSGGDKAPNKYDSDTDDPSWPQKKNDPDTQQQAGEDSGSRIGRLMSLLRMMSYK